VDAVGVRSLRCRTGLVDDAPRGQRVYGVKYW
jgi:hypothetical protein